MKNIILILAGSALGASSCTKPLSSLNVDPKSSLVGLPTAVFTQAEKNFADVNTTTSISVAPFRVISQEWTENSYIYEAIYDFAVYDCPDGWWNSISFKLSRHGGPAAE
jgi:hypothetical protein